MNYALLEFIPAEKLKQHFEVFGHFYSVTLNSGELVPCRSTLEIASKDSQREPARLLEDLPDAVFIMMNPGSSEPLQTVNNTISERGIDQLDVSLVPTKPDTTQYQIMRVMHYCGWNHARVLNISDLRNAKSEEFVEQFTALEKRTGFLGHSLFADVRAEELHRKLNRKPDAPIVCAWGVSSDLDPLIETCLKRLSGLSDLKGRLKEGTTNRYFHPFRRSNDENIKWVSHIVAQIHSNR